MNSSKLWGALEQYTETELRMLALQLGVTSAPLDRAGLMTAVMDAAAERAAGLIGAVDSRAAALVGGAMAITDMDRVAATMDEIRRDVGRLTTDVEVVKTRLADVDGRLRSIERDMRPQPTWLTWVMLVMGLLMTIVMVWVMMSLGSG